MGVGRVGVEKEAAQVEVERVEVELAVVARVVEWEEEWVETVVVGAL